MNPKAVLITIAFCLIAVGPVHALSMVPSEMAHSGKVSMVHSSFGDESLGSALDHAQDSAGCTERCLEGLRNAPGLSPAAFVVVVDDDFDAWPSHQVRPAVFLAGDASPPHDDWGKRLAKKIVSVTVLRN